MKLDYIKEKKELISIALSGISVLFAVLIFIQIISYIKLSARAQDIVQTIKARDSTKPDNLDKYLSPAKEMANSLKKSNLFAPPQEKRNPITEVRCILGNEVFINNKYYKEGEMCQDAKIVRIEPTQVTIEWDGKTTVLKPIDAAMASAGQGERPPSGSPTRPPSVPGSPSTAGPSRGTVVPPPQEQPPPEPGNMPIDVQSIITNMPPSQEQLPEQVQKQLMEAMQKARSASGKSNIE
jgi:hypothetical protein